MSVDIGASSAKSEPNVVPLCDILLVLLIIFMVVTPMIQKGANVTLPEAKFTEDQPEPGQMLTVFVKRNGEIVFDEKIVPIENLKQVILDKMEEIQKFDKKVLLKADVEVEYGKVVDAMNAIKNANIEIIGLVTDRKASEL